MQLWGTANVPPQDLQLSKAPFTATQLNATGRPVELSCVAVNGAPLNISGHKL